MHLVTQEVVHIERGAGIGGVYASERVEINIVLVQELHTSHGMFECGLVSGGRLPSAGS